MQVDAGPVQQTQWEHLFADAGIDLHPYHQVPTVQLQPPPADLPTWASMPEFGLDTAVVYTSPSALEPLFPGAAGYPGYSSPDYQQN